MTKENIYNTLGEDKQDFTTEEDKENENYTDRKDKQLKIKITKSSSINEWIWVIDINDKTFEQTRNSYNGGKIVKASSNIVINTLKEITGLEIRNRGSQPSYAIGVNQIQCDFVENSTEFETPEELAEYIKATVKKIKEKETKMRYVSSYTFHI